MVGRDRDSRFALKIKTGKLAVIHNHASVNNEMFPPGFGDVQK